MNSIYGCLELDAWARGLDYKEYCMWHEAHHCFGSKFKEESYKELCTVFDREMDRSFGRDPDAKHIQNS